MMVYDVYRGKADVPINARAENSPKGRLILKADQEKVK